MKKIVAAMTGFASLSLLLTHPAAACTDFKLVAKDGTTLITRSMEFEVDLKSNLRSSNRARVFTNKAPSGKDGLAWKAKYGFVYLDGLGQDVVFDGMNEKGLSFGYLYLPGETTYQTVPTGKDAQAVPYYNFGAWVLSNFSSVDEIKQALANIYVTPASLPGLGDMILPAHASIYDATGKGIVVEFYDNKINVSDSIGIMTNSPRYEWQVTNLRNYLNLSPNNPRPVLAGGVSFSATGQGAGMVGLPGDVSPPSRFAKTSFMVLNTFQAPDAMGALNVAEHIINNVDIPDGLARSVGSDGKIVTDTTEWVVFKDITHRVIYYRTYNNMTLRSVALDRVDFTETAARLKMPIMTKDNNVIDMSVTFLGSKN